MVIWLEELLREELGIWKSEINALSRCYLFLNKYTFPVSSLENSLGVFNSVFWVIRANADKI
jgi:hypothetical protein